MSCLVIPYSAPLPLPLPWPPPAAQGLPLPLLVLGGVVRAAGLPNPSALGDSGGKLSLPFRTAATAGERPWPTTPWTPEGGPIAPGPVAPGGGEPIPPRASSEVGARTARVTIEARLGPDCALDDGRAGVVVGSGGKAGAGWKPAIFAGGAACDMAGEPDGDGALAACSARTDGGGWKLGVGRGRTELGR